MYAEKATNVYRLELQLNTELLFLLCGAKEYGGYLRGVTIKFFSMLFSSTLQLCTINAVCKARDWKRNRYQLTTE